MLRPVFEQRNHRVVVEATHELTAVVDATRVCQIIGNLLHNASKFTRRGGDIRVELAEQAGGGVIRVIDRGAGIPQAQIGRVFEMFAKIERSHQNSSGGLGIGLALSRRLAELHDGTLTSASGGEGQGATFTLTLPNATARAAETPAPRRTTPPAGAATGPLSVVVIEDNDDVADVLEMWLEDLGHSVRMARTGAEGLDLVVQVRPDVVLCDLGLPGMDGAEVCKRVTREIEQRPVMIAMTGWGQDADRRRTAEAGFDHHLVKPVAMAKLLDILRTIQPVAQTSPPRPPSP
jgi:CheY-like chemotaxis protein